MRSGPASSSPLPRSNGPANGPPATVAKVGSGRPNAAATSTTSHHSDHSFLGAPSPRRLGALASGGTAWEPRPLFPSRSCLPRSLSQKSTGGHPRPGGVSSLLAPEPIAENQLLSAAAASFSCRAPNPQHSGVKRIGREEVRTGSGSKQDSKRTYRARNAQSLRLAVFRCCWPLRRRSLAAFGCGPPPRVPDDGRQPDDLHDREEVVVEISDPATDDGPDQEDAGHGVHPACDSTREHEGENDHGDRHFEHDPRDEQELLGDARAIHHPRDHLLQLPGTEQFVKVLQQHVDENKDPQRR